MPKPSAENHYNLSLDELESLHWNVAEQVLRSGKRYEQIYGIARGGLPLAFVLSKALGIQDVQTIRCFSYAPVSQGSIEEEPVGEPVIMLPLPFVKYAGGDRGLIADDMMDTGGTLSLLTQMQEFKRADVAVAFSKETPEQTRKAATYCGKILEPGTDGKKVWVDFYYDQKNRDLREKISSDS